MKNNYIFVLGIFLIMGLVFVSRDSYANLLVDENKSIDLVLLDNNDMNILEDNLFEYIDLIDNSFIPNTSFNISNKLSENYDFLTRFAISFILDNSEYYDITLGEEYKYVDEYGEIFATNKYISIDKIYEITKNVFGVEYYYILNDYIEVDNDMIPLLEIEKYEFDNYLDSIVKIDKYDNYMDVVVKYRDNSLDYVYRFEYIDNRYVISDLSIGE